jgi:non-homologous end joining protein Ku
MIDSFDVKMFPATEAESEICVRQINRESGERVRHQMAYTLRYAEELRRAGESFSNLKAPDIDAEQLALARELIKCKQGKFDPSGFADNYEVAVSEGGVDSSAENKAPARIGSSKAKERLAKHWLTLMETKPAEKRRKSA